MLHYAVLVVLNEAVPFIPAALSFWLSAGDFSAGWGSPVLRHGFGAALLAAVAPGVAFTMLSQARFPARLPERPDRTAAHGDSQDRKDRTEDQTGHQKKPAQIR